MWNGDEWNGEKAGGNRVGGSTLGGGALVGALAGGRMLAARCDAKTRERTLVSMIKNGPIHMILELVMQSTIVNS